MHDSCRVDMPTSEDEYDVQAGGPIELSVEDCAKIDASSANFNNEKPATQDIHSGLVAHLGVEVDKEQTHQTYIRPAGEAPSSEPKLGCPFERYRPSGRLTVTDLVAPTWCEVQFEYGLQQHRSRRIDKRPDSFITREGKEIRVEKKTAQRNDIVLREGHAVHSALEREMHPTQVQVYIKTLEEEWGLRLFNMLSDLETLMLIGKCREFPVMGFLRDHLVIGKIVKRFELLRCVFELSQLKQDEIHRVPIMSLHLSSDSHKRSLNPSVPSTPRTQGPKRFKAGSESPSSDRQLKLNSFFSITSKKPGHSPGLNNETTPSYDLPEGEASSPNTPRTVPRGTHTLHLLDSKTRLSASMPQDSATLSSRLQLMIYKRLLHALVALSPPFDFDRLWKHVGVDPQRTFSDGFLQQVNILSPSSKSKATCLTDLEERWQNAVRYLGLDELGGQSETKSCSPVNEQLTLVYRLRAAGPQDRRKRKRCKSWQAVSPEDKDLERALRESLRESTAREGQSTDTSCDGAFQRDRLQELGGDISVDQHSSALEAFKPGGMEDLELDWAVRESLKVALGSLQEPPTMVAVAEAGFAPVGEETSSESRINSGDIIGQKRFRHDDNMLDSHLTNVLQWWHGEREPRGVTVEDSNRCHTCEYMPGCEWRDKKALEALERIKAKWA